MIAAQNPPPLLATLIGIAVFVVVLWVVFLAVRGLRRDRRRRTRRDLRDRGMRDYFHAVAHQPGHGWRVLMVASFFTAAWLGEGPEKALLALAAGLLLVFPLGYLWWRRWGPR